MSQNLILLSAMFLPAPTNLKIKQMSYLPLKNKTFH